MPTPTPLELARNGSRLLLFYIAMAILMAILAPIIHWRQPQSSVDPSVGQYFFWIAMMGKAAYFATTYLIRAQEQTQSQLEQLQTQLKALNVSADQLQHPATHRS